MRWLNRSFLNQGGKETRFGNRINNRWVDTIVGSVSGYRVWLKISQPILVMTSSVNMNHMTLASTTTTATAAATAAATATATTTLHQIWRQANACKLRHIKSICATSNQSAPHQVLQWESEVVLPRLKHEWVIIKAHTKLLTVNPEVFLSDKHVWVKDKMIHIVCDPLELWN